MTEWTKRDRRLNRISPFFVISKANAMAAENNKVDDDAQLAAKLTTSEAQQAALHLGDQEVSRVERLEDKLDRQQPVAALLIPLSVALLTAAWFRGYVWIVATSAVALVAAAVALWRAARANVPFPHHTVTVPELQEIVDGETDTAASVAARAITDSQRNIPYATGVQNLVGAVRHATFTSLIFIVVSALLFAIPNWRGADGPDSSSKAAVVQELTDLRSDMRKIQSSVKRDASRDQRLRREISRIMDELRRLERQLRRRT